MGREREEEGGEEEREAVERIRFEKKLQPYPMAPLTVSQPWHGLCHVWLLCMSPLHACPLQGETESLTEDSFAFPSECVQKLTRLVYIHLYCVSCICIGSC